MDSYEVGYAFGQIAARVACLTIPLALIGGVIWFVVARSRRQRRQPQQPYPPYGAPQPYPHQGGQQPYPGQPHQTSGTQAPHPGPQPPSGY